MKRVNFITTINYADCISDQAAAFLPFYIKSAKAMDCLVSNRILLIDYHDGYLPYVPDDFPFSKDNVVKDIDYCVKNIFSEEQIKDIREIDSAFYSFLKTLSNEQKTQCILHTDLCMFINGNNALLHRTIMPYVLDVNGDVWLSLCAFTFSSRANTGNAIIKMKRSKCHYQYNNGCWNISTNTELTEIESRILSLSTTGLSARQIGSFMHLSEATIKSHKQAIFKKLGVLNISQAISYVANYDLL